MHNAKFISFVHFSPKEKQRLVILILLFIMACIPCYFLYYLYTFFESLLSVLFIIIVVFFILLCWCLIFLLQDTDLLELLATLEPLRSVVIMLLTFSKMVDGLFSTIARLGLPLILQRIWAIYISSRGLMVKHDCVTVSVEQDEAPTFLYAPFFFGW